MAPRKINNSSRQSAVSTAKTAASTGGFTKANAKSLRQAGVNRAKIKDLRNQSRGISQRNTTAAAATTGVDSVNQAIDTQFNSGLNIDRDFYNTPGFQELLNQNLNADGTKLSEAQVAKYAMDKGYGLGETYMSEFGTVPTGIRNPNKSKKNWTNYDYGKTFGGKDLKDILGSLNANKAMKIAQAAYAGGDVKKVNKLNAKIGQLNQEWINPRQYDYNYGENGDRVTRSLYPNMFGGVKAPNKVFSWNGFGNGMTQFNKEGIPGLGGSYQMGQQWSLPTKWMNGLGPASGTKPYEPWAEPTNNNPNPPGGGEEPSDPEVPADPATPASTQFGAGSDVASFATGWKSRKGSRAKAGRGAQGFASMRIAPQTAFGVGTNYG